MYQLTPFEPMGIELSIRANLAWEDDCLELNFVIDGEIALIDLPESNSSKERILGLWESTCFELFIKDANSSKYLEFNFSASGDWNCYTFEHYRSELKELPTMQSKYIKVATQHSKNTYQYKVEINTTELSQILQKVGQRKIGLNAVIKTGGKLSYWALNHPKNQPDFHDVQGMCISI